MNDRAHTTRPRAAPGRARWLQRRRADARSGGAEPPLLIDGFALVRPDEPVLQLSDVDHRSFTFFASTLGTRTLVGATRRRFESSGNGSFQYEVTLFDGNARIVEPVAPACVAVNPRLAVTQLPPPAPNPGFLVAMAAHAEPSEVCVDAPPRFIRTEENDPFRRTARSSARAPVRSARSCAGG